MGKRDDDGRLTPTPEIRVLSASYAIRQRPHLYVGTPTTEEATYAYALGACCWGADEVVNGRARVVSLGLSEDGSLTIRDDGDGMPVAAGSHDNRPACEVIMTSLMGCRDHNDSEAAKSICQSAAPMAAVNALSARCELRVHRDGFLWHQNYEKGEPVCDLQRDKATEETGTMLTLSPDSSILTAPLTAEIVARLATRLSKSFPCGDFPLV